MLKYSVNRYDRTTVLEKVLNAAITTHFRALFWNCSGETTGNYGKPHSRWPVIGPKLKGRSGN
jgi:hypothetical protein